jgi:hypothetical protein
MSDVINSVCNKIAFDMISQLTALAMENQQRLLLPCSLFVFASTAKGTERGGWRMATLLDEEESTHVS